VAAEVSGLQGGRAVSRALLLVLLVLLMLSTR